MERGCVGDGEVVLLSTFTVTFFASVRTSHLPFHGRQTLVRRNIKYIATHSGRTAEINNDSNLMNVLLHHGSSFISDET